MLQLLIGGSHNSVVWWIQSLHTMLFWEIINFNSLHPAMICISIDDSRCDNLVAPFYPFIHERLVIWVYNQNLLSEVGVIFGWIPPSPDIFLCPPHISTYRIDNDYHSLWMPNTLTSQYLFYPGGESFYAAWHIWNPILLGGFSIVFCDCFSCALSWEFGMVSVILA